MGSMDGARRLPLLLIAAFLIPACSRGGSSPHSFEVSREGGILLAVNTGGPRFEGELFEYEKVLEIQQDEDLPESLLRMPESFVMDENGFFYVVDILDCRVAVYDPEGRYVRDMGRAGEGPGEFGLPQLKGLRDGVLTIFDMSQNRTTLYGTDGTLLEVFRFPVPEGSARDLHRTPGGEWVLMSMFYHEGEQVRRAGARCTVLSSTLDTMAVYETAAIPERYLTRFRVGDLDIPDWWAAMPYVGRPVALYVIGIGILLSTGVEPVLRWYDLAGNLTREWRIGMEVEKLTAGDRTSYLDYFDRETEKSEDAETRANMQWRRDDMVFPETKALWTMVEVDDAGFTWLWIPELPDVREAGGGGVAFRLVSPEGEYLGITRRPTGEGNVMGGRFLAIGSDPETDEVILTVWKITPRVEGLIYP